MELVCDPTFHVPHGSVAAPQQFGFLLAAAVIPGTDDVLIAHVADESRQGVCIRRGCDDVLHVGVSVHLRQEQDNDTSSGPRVIGIALGFPEPPGDCEVGAGVVQLRLVVLLSDLTVFGATVLARISLDAPLELAEIVTTQSVTDGGNPRSALTVTMFQGERFAAVDTTSKELALLAGATEDALEGDPFLRNQWHSASPLPLRCTSVHGVAAWGRAVHLDALRLEIALPHFTSEPLLLVGRREQHCLFASHVHDDGCYHFLGDLMISSARTGSVIMMERMWAPSCGGEVDGFLRVDSTRGGRVAAPDGRLVAFWHITPASASAIACAAMDSTTWEGGHGRAWVAALGHRSGALSVVVCVAHRTSTHEDNNGQCPSDSAAAGDAGGGCHGSAPPKRVETQHAQMLLSVPAIALAPVVCVSFVRALTINLAAAATRGAKSRSRKGCGHTSRGFTFIFTLDYDGEDPGGSPSFSAAITHSIPLESPNWRRTEWCISVAQPPCFVIGRSGDRVHHATQPIALLRDVSANRRVDVRPLRRTTCLTTHSGDSAEGNESCAWLRHGQGMLPSGALAAELAAAAAADADTDLWMSGQGSIPRGLTMLRHLGEGAFGAVFLVRCEVTAELFALKQVPIPEGLALAFRDARGSSHTLAARCTVGEVLRPQPPEAAAPGDLFEDPRELDMLRALHHEAAIAAQLPQHPHVIRHFGSATAATHFNLVLEFAEHGTLEQFMSKPEDEGAQSLLLPEWQLKVWLAQLASGLHHLHRHRIQHRDGKPSNVLLSGSTRRAVWADFGIAAVVAAELTGRGATAERTAICTQAFAPPEVLRRIGGKALRSSLRSDVWSLGAIFFCLVLGLPSMVTCPAEMHDVARGRYPSLHALQATRAEPPCTTSPSSAMSVSAALRSRLGHYTPAFLALIDWMTAPSHRDRPLADQVLRHSSLQPTVPEPLAALRVAWALQDASSPPQCCSAGREVVSIFHQGADPAAAPGPTAAILQTEVEFLHAGGDNDPGTGAEWCHLVERRVQLLLLLAEQLPVFSELKPRRGPTAAGGRSWGKQFVCLVLPATYHVSGAEGGNAFGWSSLRAESWHPRCEDYLALPDVPRAMRQVAASLCKSVDPLVQTAGETTEPASSVPSMAAGAMQIAADVIGVAVSELLCSFHHRAAQLTSSGGGSGGGSGSNGAAADFLHGGIAPSSIFVLQKCLPTFLVGPTGSGARCGVPDALAKIAADGLPAVVVGQPPLVPPVFEKVTGAPRGRAGGDPHSLLEIDQRALADTLLQWKGPSAAHTAILANSGQFKSEHESGEVLARSPEVGSVSGQCMG